MESLEKEELSVVNFLWTFGGPATLLREASLYEASLPLLENKQKWQDRSGPAEFWYVTAWHFSQMLLKFKFTDKMQLLLSNVRAKEES